MILSFLHLVVPIYYICQAKWVYSTGVLINEKVDLENMMTTAGHSHWGFLSFVVPILIFTIPYINTLWRFKQFRSTKKYILMYVRYIFIICAFKPTCQHVICFCSFYDVVLQKGINWAGSLGLSLKMST